MPVLSTFFGISIRMYFQQEEHNPPHVHAKYNGYAAEIAIRSGEVLDGYLPAKELRMVKRWVSMHQEELMHIWMTQEFVKLPPLGK